MSKKQRKNRKSSPRRRAGKKGGHAKAALDMEPAFQEAVRFYQAGRIPQAKDLLKKSLLPFPAMRTPTTSCESLSINRAPMRQPPS